MLLSKKILLTIYCLLSISYSWAQKSIDRKQAAQNDTLNLNYLSPQQISLTDSVVNYGKLFLNTPYRYGATGTDTFDCSGFTSYIYRNFGYNLQRNSADQAQQFDTIDRTQLKTGDLVFFSGRGRGSRVGHVGIVVAAKENGEFDFIHSAVRTGVTISNSSEPYYTKRFIKANRVVGYNPMLAVQQPVENSQKPVQESPSFTPFSGISQKTKKIIPAEYHRVKSGETLSSIALKYGMSVEELKEKNDLKSSKINRRQSLLVKDEETIMVLEAPKLTANNATKTESTSPTQDATSKALHIVQKGETLTSIAKQENMSIEDLKTINNLTSGKVKVGQELLLSADVETKMDVSSTVAKNDYKPQTHKVQKGESLFTIAKDYNTTIDALKKINNLTSGKLNAGQEILLSKDVESKMEVSSPVSKNDSKPQTHKVQKGESLYTIAKTYNTTIDALKKINNLTSGKVNAGQEILLSEVVEPEMEVSSKNDSKPQTHKVQKGESLYTIAKTYNISIDALRKINNLSSGKVNVGQELKLTLADDTNIDVSNSLAEKNIKTTTHKVAKGESLYTIAKIYDTTIEELIRINNINGKDLQAGQDLKVVDKKDNAITISKNIVKSNEKGIEYKVKKGESLYTISKNNNISIEELKRINNLETSNLLPGQTLKLNDSQDKNSIAAPKVKIEPKSITHKVAPGESFYTIAKTYNCTIDKIKEWNNKTNNKINVGDKLVIYTDNI